MSKMTIANLKRWTRANRELAMTVTRAQAFAQLERARVDAYIAPIFARYEFVTDSGAPITDASKLYLCDDDAKCTAFYAECDLAHRAHGYKGEEGTCPALVAEDLQIKAENLLLASLERFIGVSVSASLELRAKALDVAQRSALFCEAA